MADFTVRQGDDFTISDTLKDADGNPVSIQNATVRLTLIPIGGGTPRLSAALAVNDQVGNGSDGTKGKVHYTGTPVVSDPAGLLLGSWIVTFAGGLVQTYPNGGYILVDVTADAPVAISSRFAESTDLEARLDLTFTTEEHIRAAKLLARASGIIRDGARGQQINLVTNDTLVRRGTTDERILLPQRPVVSVASVAIDGQEISGWYLEGNELVRAGQHGYYGVNLTYDFSPSGFGCGHNELTIVYTHGYAEIPELVAGIALEMVVRVWVNTGSVIQEAIAGTQVTYAPYSEPPRGLMLTRIEKRDLHRLLGLPMAGSVAIGS